MTRKLIVTGLLCLCAAVAHAEVPIVWTQDVNGKLIPMKEKGAK